MEPEQNPGGSPADDQASSQNSAAGNSAAPTSSEIQKLRQEAAKHRIEKNELRERVQSLETALQDQKTRQEEAAALREKSQGNYQKLYEAEVAKIQAAKSRLVDSEIRARLASAGVLDAKQQELVLPGLRSKLNVEVSDDFGISGDFETVIGEAVEVLGLRQARATETPADATPPTASAAATLLTQSMPQNRKKDTGDLLSQFKKALLE